MQNLKSLKSNIDSLAVTACKLMKETERDNFFEYQKERDSLGLSSPRTYKRKNTYHKGEKIGQIKEVWDIDGKMFNQIWELCKPYVIKCVANSYHTRYINPDDYEDVAEIRYSLFKCLRFFGPTPCSKPFSSFVSLACINVLSTSARRRFSSSRSRINFESISLFDLISTTPNSNADMSFSFEDVISNNINYQELYELRMDVLQPSGVKDVEDLIFEDIIPLFEKKNKIKKNKVKKIKSFEENLCIL